MPPPGATKSTPAKPRLIKKPAAPWPEGPDGDGLAGAWLMRMHQETGDVPSAADLTAVSGFRRDGRARRLRDRYLQRLAAVPEQREDVDVDPVPGDIVEG